ncbi:hypothetical protein ABZ403_03165 [Micromonospora zamorensis]|uniref:hypothetical protein n=1 Tax=Micromonospora zamorensis TaxID=709883 RepID=UPI0033E702D4
MSRVIFANELVDPAGLRWVDEERSADPGFEFVCFFDQVAEVFGGPWPGMSVTTVLRSGCCVTHDDGFSRWMSPFSGARPPTARYGRP